jgi:general secretion pathway protein I
VIIRSVLNEPSGIRRKGPDGTMQAGFTLLEVMIAISILAIAFATLFGSQSKSLSAATETLFNTHAPLLGSLKLAELESGLISTGETGGDFGEDFPGYEWKMTVEDAGLYGIDALADLETPLKKVTLTVSWSETTFQYSLVYYGRFKE